MSKKDRISYKVSILVPIYAVEQYIDRCACSLFAQSYSNLEFVFVDDGTPDRSIDVLLNTLKDYPARKEGVKIVRHEANRGLAVTRNTAIDYATGEFITMVDADDWLELNAVELLVKRQLETEADIVIGNERVYTSKGVSAFMGRRCKCKEERVLLQLCDTLDHSIHGKLFKRSLFQDNHIRCIDGADLGEDRYQMSLLTYFAKSCVWIDDIIYNYERRNQESIMSHYLHDNRLLYGMQRLRNLEGIRVFYLNKERVYYEAASTKVVLFIKVLLEEAIRKSNKVCFFELAKRLDSEVEEHGFKVGWREKGIKGKLKHSYFFQRLNWIKKKMVRYSIHFCE